MLIIITGAIGIGKTTVCRKVIDLAKRLGYSCGGIITPKTTQGDIIIEDIQTARTMTLATLRKIYQGPSIGKYYFNQTGIEFGIRAIDTAKESSVLLIDEVGPLELSGGGFAQALVSNNINEFKNSILVIRREAVSIFFSRLPETPLAVETTSENRDYLPGRIINLLGSPVPRQDLITQSSISALQSP